MKDYARNNYRTSRSQERWAIAIILGLLIVGGILDAQDAKLEQAQTEIKK